MTIFTSKQFTVLVALLFFCTIFATIAIPTLVNRGYNARNLIHGKYQYSYVEVTFYSGAKDTVNIKLRNEPDEEVLYLNTKGCLVKERGLFIESVMCGVREFNILASKTEDE